MTLDPAIGWILALGLALVFLTAAGHKLGDQARFRSALAGYGIIPARLVTGATAGLIGTEILTAALLVIPSRRSLGALLAAMLLVAYSFALGLNLLRGRTRIDCGCFGFGRAERISWWMVIRNLILLLAVALVAMLPISSREIGTLDVVTIVGSVTGAAIIYATYARLATPLRQGSAS